MKYNKDMIFSRQEKEPEQWRFWDFGTPAGSYIDDWYVTLSYEAQEKLGNLLKNNSKIENPRKWLGFKYMQGALKDEKIWQLSVHDGGGQVRLLGIVGVKRKQAILLIGCTHKEQVYVPPNAIDTALKRAKDFKKGLVKLYERQISTDL